MGLILLLAPAAARAQNTCGGLEQLACECLLSVMTSEPVQRVFGPSLLFGVGSRSGPLTAVLAGGLWHHLPVGVDASLDSGGEGTRFRAGLALRLVPLRLGLGAEWVDGAPAPANALLFVVRLGAETGVRDGAGPLVGVDLELLGFGWFALALRTSVAVVTDAPAPQPLLVAPSVALLFGFTPGRAYGWD